MGLQIGPFSMKAKVKGSISSHKENTRKSDNSAKYHVQVRATQRDAGRSVPCFGYPHTAINPQVSRKLRQQEHRGKNIIQLIMMLPDEV